MFKPIKTVAGNIISILKDNIDTDRIIPAKFMKTTTFEKLGAFCFYDERFDESGNMKEHPFNEVEISKPHILLTGKNFGCGSSREHAPQALKRANIQAIIAESFAEIFYGNSTTIGLVCIKVDNNSVFKINDIIAANKGLICAINIEEKNIVLDDQRFTFEMPDDVRDSFIQGTYDNLSLLLEKFKEIESFESRLPYRFV